MSRNGARLSGTQRANLFASQRPLQPLGFSLHTLILAPHPEGTRPAILLLKFRDELDVRA